jgi:CheY-like chemotaxis protein
MSAHSASRLADVTQQGGPPCLMVVDDSEASRTAIAEYFGARGWQVLMAGDAVDGLAQAITRRVDVVLMNATLPRLEGYEAAAILRKINPGVRVILLVEEALETRPRESRRMERFRFVPKPLDLPAIARAIEEEAGRSAEGAG